MAKLYNSRPSLAYERIKIRHFLSENMYYIPKPHIDRLSRVLLLYNRRAVMNRTQLLTSVCFLGLHHSPPKGS